MAGLGRVTGDDFDLAIEPVIGYRWWVLPRDCFPVGPLMGATGKQNWLTGVNEAHCNFNAAHFPPVEKCGCGFWAHWSDPPDLGIAGVPVIGVIEGTGLTLTYEHGFRCQQARITALHVPAAGVLNPLLARAGLRGAGAPHSARVSVAGARLEPGGAEVFRAITGHDPAGFRMADEAGRERLRQLAVEVAMERLGEVETQLELAYPEAEICATLPYLLLKHPPEGQPVPQAAANPCGTPHCHYTGPATIQHCQCPDCHGR